MKQVTFGLVLACACLSLPAAAPHDASHTFAPLDAAGVRQWDAWVRAEEAQGALRVRERVADPMLPGHEHERLAQYHRGVRVFGAGVTRQWRGGELATVFGRTYDVGTLETTPAIDAADAAAAASCTRRIGAAELVVYPLGEAPVLAWRLRCYRPGDLSQVFVDARTGRVADRITDIQTQSAVGDGRGVYLDRKKISATRQGGRFTADDALRPPQLLTLDMQGHLERALEIVIDQSSLRPSDVASDADNLWEDGAVVDAHAYIGWTYDYLFKRFGRRGLDDRDTPILSMVHPVTQQGALELDDELFGLFAVNAFYCGECGPHGRGLMVFGDGIPGEYYLDPSGHNVTYLSASLDVAAHELAHGVTDHSSGLIYRGESGALNEAFSDIIGTSVEFFFQPPGSAIGQADYRIGEDSFIALAPPAVDGIRSMAVPTAYGHPDHYSERYLGTADEGGVHINSGIVNHAFYLAIEGGTHRLSGVSVPGVGAANRAQIERTFFRAFTLLLPPDATFSIARAATVQAARELYGAGGAVERAVATAWTAVGVQ